MKTINCEAKPYCYIGKKFMLQLHLFLRYNMSKHLVASKFANIHIHNVTLMTLYSPEASLVNVGVQMPNHNAYIFRNCMITYQNEPLSALNTWGHKLDVP